MNSSAPNTQFRSVRLIQRGDMAQFSSLRAAEQMDAVESAPVTERRMQPLRQAEPSRGEDRAARRERRRSSEARTSDRRASRRDDARGRSSMGDTALSRDGARLRALRERSASSDFGNSRLPAGEHVSAYAGESGVVSVSRRSDRRSRFKLVPMEPSGRDEELTTTRQRRRSPRDEREFFDYDEYLEREPLYFEDDFAPRGISGSARRRQAVRSGLLAIPQGIASLIGWMGQLAATHLRGVTTLLFAALVAWMLFAPVRNLYIAHRQLDTLQATYDALLAENESIRDQLETLQTREGIENEARARGYVEAGETKVVVEGLPSEEGSDPLATAIGDVEVPDTRPWYTRLLDALFGYEPGA